MNSWFVYYISKLTGLERTKEITLSANAAHKIAKELATVKNSDLMEISDEDGLKVIFIIKKTE